MKKIICISWNGLYKLTFKVSSKSETWIFETPKRVESENGVNVKETGW